MYYEDLIVSSLAVKYYLKSLVSTKQVLSLLDIYDIDPKDPMDSDSTQHGKLAKFNVDFSEGIELRKKEVFVDTADLPTKAVIHNKNIHQAHHDIILPAILNGVQVNIAVQCKASFDLNGKKTIDSQLLISKQNPTQVHQLFWFYLGKEQRELIYNHVAFLNGSGCCNGLSLNLFEMLKKLKSKNKSTF